MSRVEYNKIMDDEKPGPGSIGLLETPPQRKRTSPLMEVPVSAGGRGKLGSTDRGLDSVADQIVKKAGVNPNAFAEGPQTPEQLVDLFQQTGALVETDASNIIKGTAKVEEHTLPPTTAAAGTTLEDIERRLQDVPVTLPEAPKREPVPDTFLKGTEDLNLQPDKPAANFDIDSLDLTEEQKKYWRSVEAQKSTSNLTPVELKKRSLDQLRQYCPTLEEIEELRKNASGNDIFKPPTPEQLKEIDMAIKSGNFKGAEVLRETVLNGMRAIVIKDPVTGVERAVLPGATELVDLYYVRDITPGTPEANTLVGAEAFVEDILRGWESRSSGSVPIPQEYESSLISTIQQQMDIATLNTLGAAVMPPTPPGEAPQTWTDRLLVRASARIHFHNGAIKAKFTAKEMGQELGTILQSNEQVELVRIPGVNEALEQIVNTNEGEYFRLKSGPALDVRKASIIAHLVTLNNPETGANFTAQEASKSLDLAEKFMHITGESAHYDGIRVNAGTTIPGAVIPADGFIGQAVLDALYTDPNMLLVDKFARFFEEHWDKINYVDSLGGTGALQLKQTYYYPIVVEKSATKNRGDAADLRKYAYLWINSGVRFQARGSTARNNILDMVDSANNNTNLKGDVAKLFAWFPTAASMVENRGAFNDKGEESVLNTPVPDANRVTNENMHETVPKALENIRKAAAIFAILPPEQKLRANLHLFKGVMQWMKSPEARGRDFQILGWNTNQYRLAVDTLIEHDFLERKDGRHIMSQIQGLLWDIAAIIENGFREGSEDFWTTLFALTRFFKYD